MDKLKVVICGQKNLCLENLKFLIDNKNTEVCAVVGSTNDWECNIPDFCFKEKIKCFVGNINSFESEIKSLKPDVIFSFQAREKFKSGILSIPTIGCFNYHFGNLPKYAGCYPIAHAILDRQDELIATMHYMTENFDDGEVLWRSAVKAKNKKGLPFCADYAYKLLTEKAVYDFQYLYNEFFIKRKPKKISYKKKFVKTIHYKKSDSIDFKKDSIIHEDELSRLSEDGLASIFAAFTFKDFQKPKIKIGNKLFGVVFFDKDDDNRLTFTLKREDDGNE